MCGWGVGPSTRLTRSRDSAGELEPEVLQDSTRTEVAKERASK